jgi:hypothetical protein
MTAAVLLGGTTVIMLLGGREVDDGCTAEWESIKLHCCEGKGDATAALVGGRGLRCWLGERRTTVALR